MADLAAYLNGCIATHVTLRDKADRIIQKIDMLEASLENIVGPRPEQGDTPERGKGSLFSLESALVLIEARLDGVHGLVHEIENMI